MLKHWLSGRPAEPAPALSCFSGPSEHAGSRPSVHQSIAAPEAISLRVSDVPSSKVCVCFTEAAWSVVLYIIGCCLSSSTSWSGQLLRARRPRSTRTRASMNSREHARTRCLNNITRLWRQRMRRSSGVTHIESRFEQCNRRFSPERSSEVSTTSERFSSSSRPAAARPLVG